MPGSLTHLLSRPGLRGLQGGPLTIPKILLQASQALGPSDNSEVLLYSRRGWPHGGWGLDTEPPAWQPLLCVKAGACALRVLDAAGPTTQTHCTYEETELREGSQALKDPPPSLFLPSCGLCLAPGTATLACSGHKPSVSGPDHLAGQTAGVVWGGCGGTVGSAPSVHGSPGMALCTPEACL